MKVVAHLTASRFFGGPERQMLGLAQALRGRYRSVFFSFSESAECETFLGEARRRGFDGIALLNDTPRLLAARAELARFLNDYGVDVLCCHGYKAGLVGRLAARKEDVPVVAVSRGWTGESLRVRAYEALDRLNLRWMDRVVCVSEGQAAKVRAAGVDARKVHVIRNAIRADRFAKPDPAYRQLLQELFLTPCKRIVGAAGRLSPEKGFQVLIDAAARINPGHHAVGFVVFGEGPLVQSLIAQTIRLGVQERFLFASFRRDLDQLMPCFDVLAIPSYTEGLPNVALEALAAGVPVVATDVGGNPEVVEHGVNGYLVPPGNPDALAKGINDALASEERRLQMGKQGRKRIRRHFTFEAQAQQYEELFDRLTGQRTQTLRKTG